MNTEEIFFATRKFIEEAGFIVTRSTAFKTDENGMHITLLIRKRTDRPDRRSGRDRRCCTSSRMM